LNVPDREVRCIDEDIMSKKHESKWNIEELTDPEIYEAIRYLEPHTTRTIRMTITASSSAFVYMSYWRAAYRFCGSTGDETRVWQGLK
jgi:hypothetical protein